MGATSSGRVVIAWQEITARLEEREHSAWPGTIRP